MKLSLIFGLGFILDQSAAAPRSLTLSSLDGIVGSDAKLLHETEQSFSTGTSHTWARHEATEATFRRRLLDSQEGAAEIAAPRAGYVVCEDTADLDGYTRRGIIEAGVQAPLEGHAFFNSDSMTCFQTHLTYEQAAGAPEDLIVHPLTHAMKVSDIDKVRVPLRRAGPSPDNTDDVADASLHLTLTLPSSPYSPLASPHLF